eukprot:gene639-694_t
MKKGLFALVRSSNGHDTTNTNGGNRNETIVAEIESWAVLPHLIHAVSPDIQVRAYTTDGTDLILDPSLHIQCIAGSPSDESDDSDHTVYFHSSMTYQPQLSGFYVQRRLTKEDPVSVVVYTKIKVFLEEADLFLFRLPDTNTWMIGDEVMQDRGFAFTHNHPLNPSTTNHRADQINTVWKFLTLLDDGGYSWQEDPSASIWSVANTDRDVLITTNTSSSISHIYQVLQARRKLRELPTQHHLYQMRNSMVIPQVGLGTGGIPHDQAKEIFSEAYHHGYRLFDMAREYQNEHLMGELLIEGIVPREEVFIESKVWPTDFGYYPTLNAISDSLRDLHTDYIDLVLLHWPQCDPSIDWMHCETTQQPEMTWREAYHWLEKALAEGLVMSIGVSNFNRPLLDELFQEASILPHVVQNYATLQEKDSEVRLLCQDNVILYQPYASMRNLYSLPLHTVHALEDASRMLESNPYEIILHCFLRSGAVMIPRTSRVDRLQRNLQIPPWNWEEEEMLIKLGCTVPERKSEEFDHTVLSGEEL